MNVRIHHSTRSRLIEQIARRVEEPAWDNRNRAEARREAMVLAGQIVDDVLALVTVKPGKVVAPSVVEV